MLAHNIYTETELLGLLKEGDTKAFTSIYQLHAPALTGFAASRLSSVEEARDIIHDLFTHLWDSRETLQVNGSLKAYLFAAVRYRIIDQIRKNITRKEYAGMLERLYEHMVADSEAEIISKDLQHTLDHAIEDLPNRTKEIYRMSRDRHLAIKEIACQLGLSEQTVKNQLSIALHHLRHSWEKLAILIILFLN
jgi:RNA polymerase sigma-70 factor (ECF subfamily)